MTTGFSLNFGSGGTPPAMKTFVYTPTVRVVIAHRGALYDVSDDIVRCSLHRTESSAASFYLTVSNKNWKYTPKTGTPVFSRMDRIVVYMGRTSEIQVFSGYLDTVPYAQLYPGTVDFKATCTIKRLMHTQWNPDLLNSAAILNQQSANATARGQLDTGLGTLLRRVLVEVGGWAVESIHIQNFPNIFFMWIQHQLAKTTPDSQASDAAIRQTILGSNVSSAPGAAAGHNPNAGPPGPMSDGTSVGGVGGVAGTATLFYIGQIVAACDDRGMGPLVTDNNNAAALVQAGQIGQDSSPGFMGDNVSNQKAWEQVGTSGQSAQTANRNSDAAILGVACAAVETGGGVVIRNLYNASAVGSQACTPNDGPGFNGTSCGIFQQQAYPEWGNVQQRMNPKQAAGMFFDHLAQTNWRNMDPAGAITAVQRCSPSLSFKYSAAIEWATAQVQAYRTASAGTGSTTVLALGGGAASGLAGAAPSVSPNLVPGVSSISPVVGAISPTRIGKPVPDSESAIQWAMTQLGKPYVWGSKGPNSYDCVLWSDLVVTERGEVQICDLTTQDRVLTREGFRRVLRVWKVRNDAEVMSVQVGGRTLTTTPDHRIWTETRGWIAAKDLGPSDILVSCRMQESPRYVKPVAASISGGLTEPTAVSSADVSLAPTNDEGGWEIAPQTVSFSTAWPTTDTQTPQTAPRGGTTSGRLGHYMWRCGSTTMALFPRGTKFITSITTPSTTTSPIWPALRGRSIVAKVRRLVSCTITNARGAMSSSKRLPPQGLLGDSVRSSTSRHSITSSPRRGNVYDVMVEGTHEFFANGVLVHNCSGLTRRAFQAMGINIGEGTDAQIGRNPAVSPASARRGDLIFPDGTSHVQLYLGGGAVIEAGSPVQITTNINPANATYVRRPVAQNGGVDPTAPFTNPFTGGPGTSSGALDSQGGAGPGASASGEDIAQNLFAYIFTGAFAADTSMQFGGEKCFLQSEPLLQTVSAICSAGLRQFISAPNGDFMAYYPDYFGIDGKKAVLRLEDIELKDFRINFSDDPLTTHVYVEGNLSKNSTIGFDPLGWANTAGVVTVEDEWLYRRLIAAAPGDLDNISGTELMRRFGASPYSLVAPMAGTKELELLMACQIFLLKWAQQYQTTVSMTFMPELLPGMRVELPGHNLTVYIHSVTHVCDFEGGFGTTAEIMAPARTNVLTAMGAVTTPGFTLTEDPMKAINNPFGGSTPTVVPTP